MNTKQKTILSSLLIILLFSFMLVSPTAVFRGAKQGLILWFCTVLPTLLPFSILSNLMIETGSLFYLSNAFGPLLRPLFRISSAGVFAVIVGFLCGYPLGAKIIGQLLENHMISKQEGDYLLSFCNNVSPIFIINYLVLCSLKNSKLVLPVLTILLASPIICGLLFRPSNHAKFTDAPMKTNSTMDSFSLKLLNQCMMDSFETLLFLGGYIMLFSIIIELLHKLSFIPMLSYITPFLEVTNGISDIQELPVSFPLKLIFTLSITSFGGFCSIAQTRYVLSRSSLSIKKYTLKKLITMLVTSLLTLLYLLFI